jgi:uncharacterized protein (TIGR03663 family)
MHSIDTTAKRQDGARGAFLERSLSDVVALDWAKVAFAAIMVLAVVSRFWDLGARALHHDESLHAFYSYNLYVGRGYIHDPLLHGTFLYHFNAFIYLLFGANDASARFAPAILSVLTVGLPYFLRKELGRTGALLASALLLISPSFLYFGRFIREDAHIAFLTLALVVCIFRYLDSRRPLWLYLFGGAFALSFNVKESTYLTAAIFGLFFFTYAGPELLGLLRRQRAFSAAGDVLVVLGTLTLTQMAGFAILYRRLQGGHIEAYPGAADYYLLGGAFVFVVLLAAVIGLRWNVRLWLGVVGVFFAVFTVFFTTMFSNPAGFLTGAIGGLVYWLAQQEVKRGAQPWYYYLLLMPLYEYLVLAFAIPGVIYYLLRRTLFTSFLIFWALGALLLYSWAGEKMPWLVLHLTLPLLLLAARFLALLIERVEWRARPGEREVLVGTTVAALVIALALSNLPRPFAADVSALRGQQLLLQWIGMSLVLAGVAYFALRAIERLGFRSAGLTLAVGSLVILVPLTVHTATQAAYTNGDVAVEMIVYTQTTPDVTKVMRELERIGFRTGAGKDLKVAYDSDVTWPFEWYLREFRGRAFYGTGMPAADAPVVLVGLENNHDAQVKQFLGSRYIGQRYRLRWWFPEDYQSSDSWLRAIVPDDKRASLPATRGNVSVLDVLRATLEPDARARLWRYFLYRETLNPLGSTDFVMYVRRDLVGGGWMPANVAAAPGSAEDPYTQKTREVAASRVIGAGPAVDEALRDPKNVAVATDGTVYVADGTAHRIMRYAPDGTLLSKWGSEGNQPGQFREPWGIAVDGLGNVYVADTWNHRIQKFDPTGRFLLQWGKFADVQNQPGGTPGAFYGPRGLAIDAEGNVLVVDTGNERVQRFSPDGAFIGQYGSYGSAEGQFVEPVGVGVDAQGNVYVADTWNRRIQKLDAQFRFLQAWEMSGWTSDSPVIKPFLAVDPLGAVIASDPEWHRLVRLTAEGAVGAVWGKYGSDESSLNLPLGVALDRDGNVYVADSVNRRVLVYPPVR